MRKRKLRSLSLVVSGAAALVLGFQNCAKNNPVAFANSSSNAVEADPGPVLGGVQIFPQDVRVTVTASTVTFTLSAPLDQNLKFNVTVASQRLAACGYSMYGATLNAGQTSYVFNGSCPEYAGPVPTDSSITQFAVFYGSEGRFDDATSAFRSVTIVER